MESPGRYNSWKTIENDVYASVGDILNNGGDLKDWNDTLIALIPKKKKVERVTDFRPINLSNVCYKIVAKVLANRWRQVLDKVIYQCQSAFIPGRLITDNILIVFECMYWLRHSKSKQGYVAFKLDMSKAYNRVEWRYMEAVMSKLGFSTKWINLILKCVMFVSYRVKFNGEVTDVIIPSRGIRHGDPMSPYLFVIVAQGLSSLLKRYCVQGKIKGLKMANRGPTITHLFFADYSLMFFKAIQTLVRQLNSALSSMRKLWDRQLILKRRHVKYSIIIV